MFLGCVELQPMGELSGTLLNSRDGHFYFIINPLIEGIGTKKSPFRDVGEMIGGGISRVVFLWQ
jgi:hypothetical protein